MKKSFKILIMSIAIAALSLTATAIPGKKHKAHAEGIDQASVSQTAVAAQNSDDNSASAQWWGGGWRGGGWRGGGWRGGWGRPYYGGWGWRGGWGWPYYGGWGGGCGYGRCGGWY
jgi:hypothetical protein